MYMFTSGIGGESQVNTTFIGGAVAHTHTCVYIYIIYTLRCCV
uniref:Uncharacterized protein n=1 Tax=Anguilla anguilla TaxID=7936 RepID=A0A0E9TNZ7_ANGAN